MANKNITIGPVLTILISIYRVFLQFDWQTIWQGVYTMGQHVSLRGWHPKSSKVKWNFLSMFFLAHLSTKCSWWAIVTGLCPSSCVGRRASCVVRKLFYLNIFSSETTHWILTKLHRIPGWSPTKVVQMVLIGCISRSRGQKIGFQNAIFKKKFSETTRPRAFIFGIKHHLEVLYQSCSNYAPGVKIDPAPVVTILHWII